MPNSDSSKRGLLRQAPFFSPVYPPFDVLPLRVRLGLAHPTGLNAYYAASSQGR